MFACLIGTTERVRSSKSASNACHSHCKAEQPLVLKNEWAWFPRVPAQHLAIQNPPHPLEPTSVIEHAVAAESAVTSRQRNASLVASVPWTERSLRGRESQLSQLLLLRPAMHQRPSRDLGEVPRGTDGVLCAHDVQAGLYRGAADEELDRYELPG